IVKEISIIRNKEYRLYISINISKKGEFGMLQVEKVSKVYEGKIAYEALTNINLAIEKGEFVGVMGPSGSGKTTLLNLIATIDEPTTGQILIEGNNRYQLHPNEIVNFRRQALGFLFQDYNLLEY